MPSRYSFYQEKTDYYTKQLQAIKKKSNFVSLLRLTSFVALAISIYPCIRDFQYGFLFILVILFIAFVLLVRVSFKLKEKKLLNEKLLFINNNELNILQNNANRFNDGQALRTQEGYIDDLDIFGSRSVFHLLNRTTTSHGRTQLAGLLQQPLQSKESIEKNQQAVITLAGQTGKRQLLIAHGLLRDEREGDLFNISDWLQTPGRLSHRPWIKIARWLLPLYNTFCIFFYLDTNSYLPLVIGVVINWSLTGLFRKYIAEQHLQVSNKQQLLDQYASILEIFNTIDAASSRQLQQLQDISGKAHKAIRQLSQLASLFDQRLNILVNLFFNSFFLYDIQCVIALEKWKNGKQDEFTEWISCVGNIECLNSLSCFAFNNPSYCYPVFSTEQIIIEAQQMAHPLIPEKERIANDFIIGKNDKLQLITGSNMSGKTTFLRTVGVNLLLAQCGAPVCADSFHCKPMHILSSLRISDSLQEHTSYFMAELKKLQWIIHQLQNGQYALVLIDEILRGTNSEDKTHGSEQFIGKLLQYNCLVLFATHDLALSEMETELPDTISNYCFESVIQQGELTFDYKLQKGVAKNKNASFLMKKMEII